MPLTRRSVAIAILAILVLAAIYVTTRSRRDFWDFEVYRTAAIRAQAGEPLYRPEDGHYQFKYWPAFAFAMMPFAWLPDEPAKVLWFGLSMTLLVVFFRHTLAGLPSPRHTRRWLTWWLLLLTAKFTVKEIVNGQTNTLLAVLVLAAVTLATGGRLRAAGAMLAVAAFVKPYALLFLPWTVAAFGAATIAPTAAVLAGGLLLPATVYGWSGNLTLLADWYATVVETTPANLLFPENISFASAWAKWLGPGAAASALATVSSALSLAVAGLVWARGRSWPQGRYLEAGVLLMLVPLLSPQGWDYMLLLALPVFACLIDRFDTSTRVICIAIVTGFALTSFTIFDLLGRAWYGRLMELSVVTVGAVLLLAAAAALRWRGDA